MGKHKPFKIVDPTLQVVYSKAEMPRDQFKEIIEDSIELAGTYVPEQVATELRLLSSTVDQVAWGAWRAAHNTEPHTVCGCPLTSIADIVDRGCVAEHPGSRIRTEYFGFPRYFDSAVTNITGSKMGVLTITD